MSVLFINLEPGEQLNASATLNLLQTSFDVVHPSLTNYDGMYVLYFPQYVNKIALLIGSLNKVFMFDKVSNATISSEIRIPKLLLKFLRSV